MDKDGRLSYDEFLDYKDRMTKHYTKQFEHFIQKTEQHHRRDYEMLCKLAYNNQGPTISTLAKATNMMMVAMAKLELQSKRIEVHGDSCLVDQWTPAQYQNFIEINNESENHFIENLPPNMYEFMESYMKKCQYETFTREM